MSDQKTNQVDNTKDADKDVIVDDVVAEPGLESESEPGPENLASEDVTIEAEEDEENIGALKAKLKTLRTKLAEAQKEKQDYLTHWQRDKADFINARKRDEEHKKDFVKYANQGLIEDLIPVLDSFSMAEANKEAWEKVDKNWRTGIEYIKNQLINTLANAGLSEINPLGQKYDPNHHEAIELVPTDDKSKDGMILEVINKGYSLNGKIIRAPKVKVGEGK